jgi:hypothetical protein
LVPCEASHEIHRLTPALSGRWRRSLSSNPRRVVSHDKGPTVLKGDLALFPGVLPAEDLVYERDRDRAFTYRGRNALDVAATHVTDGEDARPRRLE